MTTDCLVVRELEGDWASLNQRRLWVSQLLTNRSAEARLRDVRD
jgi:hypothetical protein